MIFAIYNCFTVPLIIAFNPDEATSFLVVNMIIDCLFIIDIILNFFTTYIDRNGDEILNLK
jgi:hypothetical protein